MTSNELNTAIAGMSEIWGDKPIPYMGWFWRIVDFDAKTYDFGVCPSGTPSWSTTTIGDGKVSKEVHGPLSKQDGVGFMENNKWGYPTAKTTPEEWTEIKKLIEEVVTTPSHGSIGRLRDAMEAVANRQRPEGGWKNEEGY